MFKWWLTIGYLVHVGSRINCPHPPGSVNQYVTTNNNVFVSTQKVVCKKDKFLITGCTWTHGNTSWFCSSIKWTTTSRRIKVNGDYVILSDSIGECQFGAIPQDLPNKPIIVNTQKRVKGE